ncbi:MAG: ATP-binding protein [Bacteroidales bacterium]|jgi:AAA15 family ATPase/GTPase|nr:ATP-binding protein [Bacteroidales bacterium]
MEKWIKSISGTIPHTNKNVNIALDGKNLIITGANGSGKTSFLKAMYENTDLLIAMKFGASVSATIKEKLLNSNMREGTIEFDEEIKRVKNSILSKDGKSLYVDIPDDMNFSALYDERKAIIRLFEEKRLAEIKPASTAKGLSTEEGDAKEQDPKKNFGNNLEQHLVNLKNRQALAITLDKNQILADNIAEWFVNFEKNLEKLFEDPTVTLDFDSDSLKFTIRQESKPPYTFQTLSAGYRAIFDIYAELIMRTEYFKILPKDLSGVVFIDEIDSHLHDSLQRLILPFFIDSFPNIQFIVTTHSPFVLMSAPGTVVFDLAKNEPITEDLSYFTYSAVMKGLWNIKPIPVRIENTILEIATIVNSETKDYTRLAELVKKIDGREGTLDNESKAFFLLGLEALEEHTGDV